MIHSFVINLDRHPDKFAAFNQRNPWLLAERFPAIDGRRCDEPPFYIPHARGAAASHIELWRWTAARDEPVLIAEDDATILEEDYAAEMQSTDTLLLLGWNWDCPLALSYGMGPVVIHQDQNFLRKALAGGSITSPPERLLSWPLIHAFGSSAYVLTPHGARELLSKALPLTPGYINMPTLRYSVKNTGIDCQLNLVYEKIGARVLLPPRAFTPNVRGE